MCTTSDVTAKKDSTRPASGITEASGGVDKSDAGISKANPVRPAPTQCSS